MVRRPPSGPLDRWGRDQAPQPRAPLPPPPLRRTRRVPRPFAALSRMRSVPDPLHCPFGLALGVALGDCAPLVVAALTLRHRELDLGPAVLEVHLQRHEGDALLLRRPGELVDLPA